MNHSRANSKTRYRFYVNFCTPIFNIKRPKYPLSGIEKFRARTHLPDQSFRNFVGILTKQT